MSEPPRILLLGKNGQVGWELQRSLAPLGELIALDRHGGPDPGSLPAHAPFSAHAAYEPRAAAPSGNEELYGDHLCGDLSDLAGLARTVQQLRPQIIVNAAAYTAVDKAESEPALAQRINAEAPALLAQLAHQSGAWLLHYSTDYVFNGSGHLSWREADPVGALNVYGHSKLAGEAAIVAAGCQHLIFRTSWVYAARGANFAKTMLRLAQQRERLSVVVDQHGAPTGAELIADVSAHALAQVLRGAAEPGTYHLAAAGETTWHGYASHVIERARHMQPALEWRVQAIDAVPSSAFPTPAQRPHNSRLDCSLLQSTFGLRLPPWQQGVERMLAEVLA
ncbi:MAG: dTDP-4-dehydrorhamnose reductase [Comamonadaceae bacterium BICA1-1]|nr:MAG: dTDP-4-dehydrorhamnose reductase [Comamonadaceae bacterium BICA1-1]